MSERPQSVSVLEAVPGADAVRRRPGGRNARVRDATIRATLEQLAESGWAGLSLERVARRAGVHKTTLYRRWGRPEALLLDTLLETARDRVPIPDTGSCREDLIRYARAIIRSLSTPEMHGVVRAFASEVTHEGELDLARRQYWESRFELAGVIVSRGIERGELRADVSARRLLEGVLGQIYLRLLVTGGCLGPTLAEEAVDLVLAGASASEGHKCQSGPAT
jgi:AcrR family transcriptional regulator